MYAKLNFPSTVTVWQRCRDIARLIHESSSGTASLSNLEFINVGDSELIAGVNSGWSLAGAQTIATGAASASDGNYIFESPCVDTNKQKYVSIRPNGNITNTTIGNSSQPGVFLAPVVDYDTATVNYVGGYSGTDNNYSRCAGVGSGNGDVFVIATPRKLALIGNSRSGSYKQLELYMEYTETGQSQYYNLVPSCKITDNTHNGIWPLSMDTGSNLLPTWYNTGTGYARSVDINMKMIQFPKSLYNSSTSNVVRLLNVGFNYITTNVEVILWHGYYENGTAAGVSAGQLSGPSPQWLGPNNFFSRYSRMYVSGSKRNFQEIDAGRNVVYPLYPFKCAVHPWRTGIIDFELTGIYQTVGGLGIIGDKVRVGESDYLLWSGYNSAGSTLIRIE